MTDLVQRLRDGLEAGAVDLADIMDAADAIERASLTDAEREAITVASIELNALAGIETNHSAALRDLLTRFS